MAKRISNKEVIDRQLVGQSSSTPFMDIWEGYNSNKKIVSFDIQNSLDYKIETLTSIKTSLSIQGGNQNKPCRPKIC